MKKSYLVILGVIGLFITITGATFAYFMLNNSVNELETDVTAAIIAEVDFEGGPEVVVPEHGIYPGWIGVQEFTVKKPDLTSGKGSYRVNLETTIAAEFQDWITIEVYKTTDDKDTITRVEGEVVSDEINPNEIFVVDKITINGFTDSEKKIMNTTVINSTSGTIEIDEQEVDMATMTDVRYYIVYRFTNADENQNAAQGANFKTKVTIDRGASIATYEPEPNAPVLDSKMIPVVIGDTGVLSVADTEVEWYNYTDSEWANAIILNTHRETTPGEVIEMTDIAQMYVWIPRYEYSKSSIESAAHAIDVTFVDVNTTTSTAEMEIEDIIVHPAFCWGNNCQYDRSHTDNIELPGLWVGKFELGWQDGFVDDGNNNNVNTTYITKPNVNSVHDTNIATIFNNIQRTKSTYSMDIATDVHMIKNTEWGAINYLSQSKYGICNIDGTCTNSEGNNIKVEGNNFFENETNITTGCSSNSISIEGVCPSENKWNSIIGIKASTTNNISGVYDMAAGRLDTVMAVVYNTASNIYEDMKWMSSGFSASNKPDKKYYDAYDYVESNMQYDKSIIGDAILELNPTNDIINDDNILQNWNNTYLNIANSSYSWYVRGGRAFYSGGTIWSSTWMAGGSSIIYTSRSILITNAS